MLQVARPPEDFAIRELPRGHGHGVRTLQHNDLPWVILCPRRDHGMIVVIDNETKGLIYIIAGSDLVLVYMLPCCITS